MISTGGGGAAAAAGAASTTSPILAPIFCNRRRRRDSRVRHEAAVLLVQLCCGHRRHSKHRRTGWRTCPRTAMHRRDMQHSQRAHGRVPAGGAHSPTGRWGRSCTAMAEGQQRGSVGTRARQQLQRAPSGHAHTPPAGACRSSPKAQSAHLHHGRHAARPDLVKHRLQLGVLAEREAVRVATDEVRAAAGLGSCPEQQT